MSVLNTETGEILDLDRAAAERRAERITLRLDAIADNYRAVLPMIREAIEKRDDLALGYRSPGDYVSDRFGQSLAGLGIEVRRAVVGELTEAGLSTRAIAPVVGASRMAVQRDREAGVTVVTPEPTDRVSGEAARADDPGTPNTPEGEHAPPPSQAVEPENATDGATSAPTRPPVVGIDGKTYTSPKPATPRRRPITDAARDGGFELRKAIERLERISADDRFAANKEQVAAHLRGHLTNAVEVCQDLLDRINN